MIFVVGGNIAMDMLISILLKLSHTSGGNSVNVPKFSP